MFDRHGLPDRSNRLGHRLVPEHPILSFPLVTIRSCTTRVHKTSIDSCTMSLALLEVLTLFNGKGAIIFGA